MDFGYKSLIATALVCASWCKAKSMPSKDNKVKADTTVVIKSQGEDSIKKSDFVYKGRTTNSRPVRGGERPDIDEDIDTLDTNDRDSIETATIGGSPLDDLEYDAVRLIAMSESIEMNAYYDKAAGKWTIGFGNTTHPDGSPVKKGDKIESEEELMYYFREYFNKRVADNINKYLPTWNEFNKQEKLALLDLFWNAGSGRLHTSPRNIKTKKKQEVKPSQLANALNVYAKNRNQTNLNAVIDAMKAKEFISTRRKGIIPALQKRVAFRIKIFTGEIQLGKEGETSIDLDSVKIGAHYGAFKPSDVYNLNFSKDKLKNVCDTINNCPSGRNFVDTLEYKKTHAQPIKSTYHRQQQRRQQRYTSMKKYRGR